MLTIVVLLLGSLIVLASGLLARRFELSESLGFSLALSLLGLLIVLMPTSLKGLLLGYLSEYIIVYAKNIGLIGLFFLMGTNFSYKSSLWTQKTLRLTLLGIAQTLIIALLLTNNKQPRLIGKPIRAKHYRKNKAIAIVITSIIMLSNTIAKAQSTASKDNEDPVSRALRNVNLIASQQVVAAEQAIAVSKQLKESMLAQKAGETDKALARLAEAEKLASQNSEGQNSLMLNELLAAIAIQRLQLTPQPNQIQITSTNSPTLISLPRYRTAFARFQQYGEHLRQILTEEKAPSELISIAIIESGLNPQALSPKGARGIWQFMPATARRYGLPVNATTDHRIYPEHSTRAAARYLLDLYNQFGDWKLALAAYNAGETKIQTIIERTGIRDFDEMARRGYLPLETRNYVPAVLAIWLQLGEVNLLTFPRKTPEASKTSFNAPGQIIEAPMILQGKED